MLMLLDWFFRDRRTGRIVIGQWPNLPLWMFGAASAVEFGAGSVTPVGKAARLVGTGSLVYWAGDEALRGVNPWRRCLGVAVLIGEAVRRVA